MGALGEVVEDDEVAVGGVFVRDERAPGRRGCGDDEAGGEGWVWVEGLPGGADDVAAPLGGVGGYGREEPGGLLLLLLRLRLLLLLFLVGRKVLVLLGILGAMMEALVRWLVVGSGERRVD